ncbi:Calpain [Hondaea fermentalgiana]|uniref:Calpain n=1 Tax=Hondaea fermentalgiana TaxID=2315210 RepID=A0A2R5G956_9STRA|nr:Calpain [Hondaea fermentalgiana]|eukprot:GBG25013.1 Calpain [Hondaea fermentalgiana]
MDDDDAVDVDYLPSPFPKMIASMREDVQLCIIGVCFATAMFGIAFTLERVKYRWWLIPGRIGTLLSKYVRADRRWSLRLFHWTLIAAQAAFFAFMLGTAALFASMLALSWTTSSWGDFVQNSFSGILFCGSCFLGVLGGRLWHHNAATLAASLNVVQRSCDPAPITSAEHALRNTLTVIGVVAGTLALLSDFFLIPFGRCSEQATPQDQAEADFCEQVASHPWLIVDVWWPLSGSWVPMTLSACLLVSALYFADLYIHASHDVVIEAYSHQAELRMRFAGVRYASRRHSVIFAGADESLSDPSSPNDDEDADDCRVLVNDESRVDDDDDDDDDDNSDDDDDDDDDDLDLDEDDIYVHEASGDLRKISGRSANPIQQPDIPYSLADIQTKLARYRRRLKRNFITLYALSVLVLLALAGTHMYFTGKSFLFFECIAIFLTDLLFISKFYTSHVSRVFSGMKIHVGGMEATPLAIVLLVVRAVLFSTPSQGWFVAQSIACLVGICYLIWNLMPSYLASDVHADHARELRRLARRWRNKSCGTLLSSALVAYSREIVGLVLFAYFSILTCIVALPEATARLHFATRTHNGIMVCHINGTLVPLWEFGLTCIIFACCFGLHMAESLQRPKIPDFRYLRLLCIVFGADLGFAYFISWSHLFPGLGDFFFVNVVVFFPAAVSCVWGHRLWVSADYVFLKHDGSKRDWIMIVCFVTANITVFSVPPVVHFTMGADASRVAIPVVAFWSFIYGLLAAQCWCNTLQISGNRQLHVLFSLHLIMTIAEAVLGSPNAFVSPALTSAVFIGTLYHDHDRMTFASAIAVLAACSSAIVTALAAPSTADATVVFSLVLVLCLWVAFFVAAWQPLALQPSIVPVFVVLGVALFMILKLADPFVHFCLLVVAIALALVSGIWRFVAQRNQGSSFKRMVLSSSFLGVPAVVYTVNQKGGDLRIRPFGRSGIMIYTLFVGQILTYLCSAWLSSNIGTVTSSLLYCVLFVFVLERSLARLVRFRRNFTALQLQGLENIFEAAVNVAVERSVEISQQAIMSSWLRDERPTAFARDASRLLEMLPDPKTDRESLDSDFSFGAEADASVDTSFMILRTPEQLMQYYAHVQAIELENDKHSRDGIHFRALFDELLVMCSALIRKSGPKALPEPHQDDRVDAPWLKQEAKDPNRTPRSSGALGSVPHQRPFTEVQESSVSTSSNDSREDDGLTHQRPTTSVIDENEKTVSSTNSDGEEALCSKDACTKKTLDGGPQDCGERPETRWSDPEFSPSMESICGMELGLELDNCAPVIEEDIEWWPALDESDVATVLDSSLGDLAEKPVSLVYKPKDVVQGAVGDCWLLSAISVVALWPDLMARVMPRRSAAYPGRVRVSLFVQGDWHDVVVDDSLPCLIAQSWDLDGNVHDVPSDSERDLFPLPLFCRSRSPKVVWPMLLEKAFAKTYGSYEMLRGGHVHAALVDLTGGLTQVFQLKRDLELVASGALWKRLKRFREERLLLAAGTDEDWQGPDYSRRANRGRDGSGFHHPHHADHDDEEDLGITPGHAYAILDVVEEVDSRGRHCLLKLRDPWGTSKWKGAWNNQDSERWTRRMRARLSVDKLEDSEAEAASTAGGAATSSDFWMSMDDFVIQFKELYVCRVFPERKSWHHRREFGTFFGRSSRKSHRAHASHEDAPVSARVSVLAHDSFAADVEAMAAAHQRGHDGYTDQFALRLHSSRKYKHGKVYVSITQITPRGEEAFMTLALLNNNGERVAADSEVRNRHVVATAGAYRDTREVSLETSLPCGETKFFTLLPSLYTDVDVKFTINVYSECEVELRPLRSPSISTTATSAAPNATSASVANLP